MTAVRRVVVAGAAATLLLAPADAGAARLVRAKPGLKPSFQTAMPDYTVRCRSGTPVRFAIDAPSGTTVAVDGGPARSGSFEAPVSLAPGRRASIRVKSSAAARNYSVRCVPADFPRWRAKRYARPQAAFYLLTPNDNRAIPNYVTVVDSYGVPIWWMRSAVPPFDGHLLPNGDIAWNRWVGNSPEAGPFEEHALDGRLVRNWSTVGHTTNQHDLQVLPNGNALMISYPPRDHVDLSPWRGPKDATVLDGEIQEVTPSGGLAWSWSTEDHLALSETGRWMDVVLFKNRPIHLADGRTAWDVVHMNSVEPVGDGGKLLFSARYEDAAYLIDKASGKVIWKLGGRQTKKSLRLVGDDLPASKEFGGSHDARDPKGDGSVITLYDNGTLRDRPPRVVAFRIDVAKRTAKLIRSVSFGPAKESVCCGSARMLPGGNWVVAWGHTPWVTEQTGSGERVFTLQFESDIMMSYRAEPILPGRLSRSALRLGMDAMGGG